MLLSFLEYVLIYVKIEIRWCPSHQGIEGARWLTKWAKLAAEEPNAHGVEWFGFTNPRGQVRRDASPSRDPWPTPNLGKEMDRCEKLGEEEAQQDEQPQVPSQRITEAGHYGLASRFYQLKTGSLSH